MELANTVDEAVVELKKNDDEYEGRFEDKCGFEGKELPRGVTYLGNGKWKARVWHPKLKFSFWIGSYSSLEETVMAIAKKKAEFRESGGDDYEGKKLPFGVRRRGYCRWQAQITHPTLKIRVSLGCYDTPEEAAMAVCRAKAEFGERFKSKSVNVETCGKSYENDQWDWVPVRDEPEKEVQPSIKRLCMSKEASKEVVHHSAALKDKVGSGEVNVAIKWKKSRYRVPFGVYLTKSGKWESWATHPITGRKLSLVKKKTFEEAVNVAIRKRAEFDETYKPIIRIRLDSEAFDDQEEPEQECDYGCSRSASDPDNVNSTAVRDELSNVVANARAANKRKSQFSAKKKRAKSARKFMSINKINKGKAVSQVVDAVEKSESDFDYGCPNSTLGAKNVYSSDAGDNWSYEGGNGLNKLCQKFLHGSPTSVFNPENTSCLDIHDDRETAKENPQISISASNFEEAVGLGFINEYGQLLGKYSMLDEQLGLNLPDD